MSSLNYMELCRLCLVKERVSIPIFEGEGDVRQIYLKIASCLPVKVARDDKLPKKICDDCMYKLDNAYQFWNITANAEKQLLQWLGEITSDDKKSVPSNTIETEQLVLKEEAVEQDQGSELAKSLSRVEAVLADDDRGGSEDEEESESEDEGSNSEDSGDDDDDGGGGEAPSKEEAESDEEPYEPLEPTTFVNVSLAGSDEAGPSGIQQQQQQQQQQQSQQQSQSSQLVQQSSQSQFLTPGAPSTSTAAPASASGSTKDSGSDVIREGATSYLNQQQKVFLVPTLQGLVMMVVVGDKRNANLCDSRENNDSNSTANIGETSYMCGGILKCNSVTTNKEEPYNYSEKLKTDVNANMGGGYFSSQAPRNNFVLNSGQKSLICDEFNKKINATRNLSQLKHPHNFSLVPAQRREVSNISLPNNDEENDIYAKTLKCTSVTISGESSYNDGETLIKSDAISDDEEIIYCGEVVSGKSIGNDRQKSYMCDKLTKKSDTTADLSVLNWPQNVTIPAVQGKTMLIKGETRSVSPPRIDVNNYIFDAAPERSNNTESYVGGSYVRFSTLNSNLVAIIGEKSHVSSEDVKSNTVTSIERKASASGDTLKSNAGDETVRCNAVANAGKESVDPFVKLSEGTTTEKLGTFNQHQKFALLPTTLGCMIVKLDKTRLNSNNTTDYCGDSLKNDPAENSAGNTTSENLPLGDATVIPGDQRQICFICGKIFDKESTLDLHLKTHNFLCDICGKVLLTSDKLRRHKRSHKERLFTCDICNKTFKFTYQLNSHHKIVHSGIKNHICNICGYAAAFKSALKAHENKHLHDFRYHCDVCGKGFHEKHQLKTHMNFHSRNQPFSCNICGKAFFYKHYLTRHKRTTHPEVQKDGSTKSFEGHECEFCGRVLKHKKTLLLHMSSHTGGNRTFLCDICGRSFRTNHQLEAHKRVHTGEKPFVCDVCAKAFGKKSSLRMHMCVHTREKHHRCDECGKSYTQQSSLIVHKRYHTGQRPYHCLLCNKGFVTKTQLKMHQNTVCV